MTSTTFSPGSSSAAKTGAWPGATAAQRSDAIRATGQALGRGLGASVRRSTVRSALIALPPFGRVQDAIEEAG
jgi:hypothetical protein